MFSSIGKVGGLGRHGAMPSLTRLAYLLRNIFTTRDGAWFDSDIDELNQLSTGITPVAAVGDPVGRMYDKHAGENASTKGVYLTGASGTYVSSPTVSITGGTIYVITARISPAANPPAAVQTIAGKWTVTGNQRSFAVNFDTTGKIYWTQSSNGTNALDGAAASSTVVLPVTANFVKITKNTVTGTIVYETSIDGVTYTQLGTTISGSATVPFNSTALMEVGSSTTGSLARFIGKIYEADITVDGVLKSDFDAIDYVTGPTLTNPTTGQVWTLNGAAHIAFDGNHVMQATAAARSTYNKRVNWLLASAVMSIQNVSTLAVPYTLTFTGTGTITLSGTSTAGPLVGTGVNDRVSLTFTPTAGTLTLTVIGSVTLAQLEFGSAFSRYQGVITATNFVEDGFTPYVNYDGVDDNLTGAYGGGGSAGVFWCESFRPLTASGSVRTIFSDAGTNTGYKVEISATGKVTLSAGNGGAYTTIASTASVAPGDKMYYYVRDDGVNLSVCINGGVVETVARPVVVAGTTTFTLGKDNGAASGYRTAQSYASVYFKNTGGTDAEVATAVAFVRQFAGL